MEKTTRYWHGCQKFTLQFATCEDALKFWKNRCNICGKTKTDQDKRELKDGTLKDCMACFKCRYNRKVYVYNRKMKNERAKFDKEREIKFCEEKFLNIVI